MENKEDIYTVSPSDIRVPNLMDLVKELEELNEKVEKSFKANPDNETQNQCARVLGWKK